MTLITTENEIELAAMKIADQNHWQARQIWWQWLAESISLRIADLHSGQLRLIIFQLDHEFTFAVK